MHKQEIPVVGPKSKEWGTKSRTLVVGNGHNDTDRINVARKDHDSLCDKVGLDLCQTKTYKRINIHLLRQKSHRNTSIRRLQIQALVVDGLFWGG